MTPVVASALRRAGFDPRVCAAQALRGGITNRNFRVERGGESFVLRLGGQKTALLGIDRRREGRAGAVAAALGVGADVVYFSASADVLMTRFVSGRTLSAAALRRPENLRLAARALRRLHGGPSFSGRFSPFSTIRRYAAAARRHGVVLPKRAEPALRLLGALEGVLWPPARLRPCHNDLLGSNMIAGGGRLKIIDWEYAAMGDPFFDLANFCVNNALGPAARAAFLKDYHGRLRDQDARRLELMGLVSDLREAFWGFVQAGLSTLDFDFEGYGRRHLARFWRSAEKSARG